MKRLLLIPLLLSMQVFSLMAQDTIGNTVCFSLKDAQTYAIEHNRKLMNASLSERQAEAQRWTSIASMLPQVSGSMNYSDLCGYEINLGPQSIAMPANGTIGINVGMAFSGAQVVASQIGTISMKMADISHKQTEQEIAEQVKMLYYSALLSEETQDLLEMNLETLKKLYDFAQKSVDVGVSEQVDADQILVQISTLETSINASKRATEMVYNSMRLQMNIDFDQEIKLTDPMEKLLDVENSLNLLSEDFYLENNYNYQLALQNTQLKKKQKSLAGWAYGPTLSAIYQYSAKKYFSDEITFNMTPPNMVGLTLSVPIFSSGKNLQSFRTAKFAYQQELNNLADTEMALKIQHRQLKYNMTSAYERLETQKKSVNVSQSVFDNISKKYEFGYSSSLDVTTSTTNLISAQSQYVQAALDFVKAEIELEKLLNKNYLANTNE